MNINIQIKVFFILMVLSIQVVSCGDDGTDEKQHKKVKDTTSSIEATQDLGEAKNTDILTLVGINDNYDYWYAYFKSDKGLETFVYGPNVKLKNELVGSEMRVAWVMDTLYEAGEGDEPYEQKRILSFEIVRKAPTFFEFMHEFAKVYGDTLRNIDAYKSKEVPYNKAWNPGVACFLGANPPGFFRFVDKGDYNIAASLPEGDFCEGYEGVKDGFYFEEFTPSMPTYAQLDDEDIVEITVQPPKKYQLNAVRKVLVIQGEWQYAYLYFVLIDREWKLWIQDLCDCSA